MRRRTIFKLTKEMHLSSDALNQLYTAMEGIPDSSVKEGSENHGAWLMALDGVKESQRSKKQLTKFGYWSGLRDR